MANSWLFFSFSASRSYWSDEAERSSGWPTYDEEAKGKEEERRGDGSALYEQEQSPCGSRSGRRLLFVRVFF